MIKPLCRIDQLEYAVSDEMHLTATDLSIDRGQVVHLDAPSGSGKTLFGLALMGFVTEPASLRLKMSMEESASSDAIGMMFQQPSAYFNPVLTIGEHLTEAGAGYAMASDWQEAFDEVDLSASACWDKLPHACAVGELQRIYWLMIRSRGPRLIFADEPFAHVDHTSRTLLIEDMMDYLSRTGAAMIIVSHDVVPRGLRVDKRWEIKEGIIRYKTDAEEMDTSDEMCARDLPDSPSRIGLNDVSVQLTDRDQTKSVLHQIDLSIMAGQRIGIMGRSGSGKSTLLALIKGIKQPSAGVIQGVDQVVYGWSTLLQRPAGAIQMIGQDPYSAFEPQMPLGRQIRSRDGAALHADMRSLGLDPDLLRRRPAALSGGELQRLSILAAVHASDEIELIMMDETLSALDHMMRRITIDWLLQRAPGLTMVCVAHRYEHIRSWCDVVYVLHEGRLACDFIPGQEDQVPPSLRGLLEI